MVFSSSSPVPSESLVLNVTQTLLIARPTNLTDSVKVLNFTYEKISDTSYALNFTFNISSVSMTQNPDLRNDTYSHVKSIINNALNTLLNEAGAEPFEPQSSVFTSSGNQVNGDMTYHFQDGDTKTPAAFLNELKAQSTPITGSAVVQTRMVFSSSSPVPSESLVLNVTQTLLSTPLTNLTDSVKVLNFTYEKISDTSYALNFTFNISSVSMTQNPDLRNDTYSHVKSIINNALNTLLNEAGAEPFEPQSSVFTSSGNQVNGDMTYHFQDGDTKTPAAFLNELKAQSTPITGSAVVQTRMVFSSSSPVPSESLVLNVTQTLLSTPLTNLTDSVKVLNFTYEKISDTSYALNFTFNISSVSMTQNPDLRNDTYSHVKSIINNALNTLLNEAGAEPFEPQSSVFTSSGNQVNGDMTYHFQDGDTKTPAAFLNELKAQSTPIESLVLNVTQTLLSTPLTNLTDSVKVLNFTYEKISDTSYALNFTFNISSVSMTQNPDLRNDTYSHVKSIINNALNTLLNEAGAEPFEPQSSVFTSSGNQVNGDMTYHFQDGDTKTPAAFLNELKAQSTPITGSAVVQTRMVFSSSSPVPSESLVLNVTQTLLSTPLTNLTDSVKVLNFTYEKISDTSYALNFTFNISSVSMTQNPDLRNDTYSHVKSIINNALNTLLNEAGAEPFEPQSSVFTSSGNQVNGDMTYHFQDGDTKTPAAFLNELKAQSTPIIGSAVVQTRMVFSSSSPVPSESLVLTVTQTLLSTPLTNLTDSVKVLNFTYEKISDTSYALNFTFNISSVSMTQNPDLRNDTYSHVKSIINNALNTLLNEAGAEPFEPQSSVFTSSGNQVNGDMTYHFQDGDTKTPAAFLNELKAQSTPIESLVLNVTQTLLSTPLTNLTDSVKVLNFTYEKISDTSYALNFTFNISSVSMTQNPDLRNDTYSHVKSIINNALNTLLNEAGAEPFEPQSSVFTSSGNQVNGDMTYHFQDGDTKTPAAFLNELKAQSTPITGSAVVQTRMVFSSSSPVPSESLVLNVTQTLLSTPLTNLTDSVKVLNFTYEKISDTSYALNFTFNISSVSMTQNPDLRNDTYSHVKSIINNALNTLLNEAGAEPFEPQSSVFTSSGNQVNGDMTYHFQDGDTKTPAAFLNELKAQSTPIIGSAVVQTRMVFSSSSPVPSESLVLTVTQTLLSTPLTNLTDSVKVLNFTYEKISDTSYALNFTFNISSVSMTQNPDLRNDTYSHVKSIINNALNTLLNEAGAEPFEPQSSVFTSSGNQVNGDMTYHFQDGDTKTPAAFLNELKAQSTPIESLVLNVTQTLLSTPLTNLTDSVKVLNFTYEKISDTSYALNFTFNISSVSMTQNPDLRNDTYSHVKSIINNALNTLLNEAGAEPFEPQSSVFTSSGNQVNGDMTYHFQDGDTKTPAAFLNELKAQSTPITGSAVVQTRMVFSSSSPVPSESLVLNVTQTLLSTRLTNLTDSVKVLNFTYEKISDTSYALNFTFNISSVSMTQNPDLRNDTYSHVKSIINNALNTLLNEAGAEPFESQSSIFTRTSRNHINGDMMYHFQDGDTKTPAAFLNELTPVLGKVLIYIRLVFKNLTRVPSEADVLNAANALLDAKIRRARDLVTQKLSDPVSIQDVKYQQIDNKSYIISFGFQIGNVTISKDIQLRNETYNLIQTTINNLLNTILNVKGAPEFVFPFANLTLTGTEIVANSEYVFVEGDTKWTPSGFLFAILNISGLSTVTTPAAQTEPPVHVVLRPTVQAQNTTNGGNSAWILGIIIPCSIVIILIPCWILLCCLLCGCCAGLRRRYNRRRSYNVQYATRNGLF
ncbi:hypothetical protein KOW79_002027 [Hemibagrus wyckioides]|uniref:Uncharacterized protein n=1 Tax=Hemibagrus wyckioides TaxID=337641 RepID=A0A9D3SSL7_9TELE|nr:hypothetical protein KOW79_002027 [Hemibagrus wyckioides]